jgi:hypothetical protein
MVLPEWFQAAHGVCSKAQSSPRNKMPSPTTPWYPCRADQDQNNWSRLFLGSRDKIETSICGNGVTWSFGQAKRSAKACPIVFSLVRCGIVCNREVRKGNKRQKVLVFEPKSSFTPILRPYLVSKCLAYPCHLRHGIIGKTFGYTTHVQRRKCCAMLDGECRWRSIYIGTRDSTLPHCTIVFCSVDSHQQD